MTSSTKSFYAGHRFPPELISYTAWLYYRFPLSLRMVEEMLAFRGIEVSHETIRQWGLGPKGNAAGGYFGREFANIIRRRLPRPGDKCAGGHGGTFIPEGIRWAVERSLAWISRYHGLNTIFERAEGHLVAFVEIAFISILARRLKRLVTGVVSA